MGPVRRSSEQSEAFFCIRLRLFADKGSRHKYDLEIRVMRPSGLIITVLIVIVGCFLFLLAGCEEESMAPRALNPNWFQQQQWAVINQQASQGMVTTAPQVRTAPMIKFEKTTHDFGDVGPGTKNYCEFRFTNAGNGVLRIGEITQVCGCTPFALDKKEYAPGEVGILRVGYYADLKYGSVKKQLFVQTNDRQNPMVALDIESRIVSKVDFEPKSLRLSLKHQNAGCPQIVIASLDNQPFSIRSFKSSGNSITVDFNPSVRATSFVLQPRVDMTKLEQSLRGRIDIELTHPECKAISIGIDTLPRYNITPRPIIARDVNVNKVITKKVRIQSNYNDNFELKSVYSKKGTVNILKSQKIDDGYELELSIKPPAQRKRAGVFTDEVVVEVKGQKDIKIPFSGYYPRSVSRPQISIPTTTTTTSSSTTTTTSQSSTECKTCGPKIF